MPADDTPPARSRGWVLGLAGFIYLVARSTYRIIHDSGIPNGYLGRHWHDPDFAPHGEWPYPTDTVRTFLILLGIDLVLALLLFAKRSQMSLAGRSAILATLQFFGLVMMFPMMMHASEPFPSMFGFLLMSCGWCILFAFIAAILAPARRPKPT